MTSASLHELQDWFLTVMTAPGGVGRGAALAAGRHAWRLDEVVAHTHGAAPDTRMHIYADGYVLRLLDCLRADYPMLLKVMGDPLFTFFAKAYVWRHPSTSPSLYDLGAGFAAFLADSQSGLGEDAGLLLPIELARLERARTEAGRARGLERGGTAQPAISHSLALMLGQNMTLSAPPCLRLLDLALPLLPFVDKLGSDGMVPPAPEPQRSYVGVTRMRYRVRAHALEAWQFHLLHALVEQDGRGTSSQHCVQRAAERAGLAVDHLAVQMMLWLPTAAASGLVLAETFE
jgi:hypothetical protein